MARLQQRSRHRERHDPTSSGEAVPTYQLAEQIREFCRVWLAERPQGDGHLAPMDYLAEQSGVHVRTIARIVAAETTVTQIDRAERLLIAMDRDHLITLGEVDVVPPHWSLERWLDYQRERGGCDDDC